MNEFEYSMIILKIQVNVNKIKSTLLLLFLLSSSPLYFLMTIKANDKGLLDSPRLERKKKFILKITNDFLFEKNFFKKYFVKKVQLWRKNLV